MEIDWITNRVRSFSGVLSYKVKQCHIEDPMEDICQIIKETLGSQTVKKCSKVKPVTESLFVNNNSMEYAEARPKSGSEAIKDGADVTENTTEATTNGTDVTESETEVTDDGKNSTNYGATNHPNSSN